MHRPNQPQLGRNVMRPVARIFYLAENVNRTPYAKEFAPRF
jgi:hypothetical protein